MGHTPIALLLDLDGTLIDSEPSYKRTEAVALRAFGVEATGDELDGYTGTPLREWLARLSERHGVSIVPEEFVALHRPAMEAEVALRIQPFPDALRLLSRFSGPAVLVTSSARWYVEAVFERFPDLARRFQAIVAADDVGRGKPHPEPYLRGARLVGVDPGLCLAVEDSPSGVASARASGCRVVGIDRVGRHVLLDAHEVLLDLDRLGLPVRG